MGSGFGVGGLVMVVVVVAVAVAVVVMEREGCQRGRLTLTGERRQDQVEITIRG